MNEELTRSILNAWEIHGNRITSDPLELSKRLARRRLKSYGPMRAWCVAVRASDLRINPATAMCHPAWACYPRNCLAPSQLSKYRFDEHEVTLTAPLLRTICQPVRLKQSGNTVAEVTKMLGVSRTGVEYAIKRGVFQVELRPRHSRSRPPRVLKSDKAFDPSCSSLKQRSDPLLDGSWAFHADALPDDFEQAVIRVPARHPTRETFIGWRWICPACKRIVRTVFYPLKPPNLPESFGIDPAKMEFDRIEAPPATFACVKCHGVRYFNSIGPNPWNELIFHLSGGLLYGYEVKRPAWLIPQRKKPFKPQLGRAPSTRRAEVLERLLKGWTYRQIATDIGSGYATVHDCVAEIYKQHRVKSRSALIARQKKLTRSEPKEDAPHIEELR